MPLLGGQSAPVVRKQIEAAAGLAHTARTMGKPTGRSDPQDWQDSLNMMTAGGDLAAQDVKAPEFYFTNEYLSAPPYKK